MASFFNLTLDTTGPQSVAVSINNGAAKTNTRVVNLAISTADGSTTGYQMKIWGIDGVANEGSASWETFQSAKQVTLTTGDGTKTVYVKLRDDVYNESAVVNDTIVLDTNVPVVTITGPDYSKISKVGGKDTATISFVSDVDFVQYKVCVVSASTDTQALGTVIPTTGGSTNTSGSGSFDAQDDITVTIKGADLEAASAGDGTKIVKVFVKTDGDNWSV